MTLAELVGHTAKQLQDGKLENIGKKEGQPLFQYGKSELQTEVDITRKEGMTDAEIRKFLEAIEQPKEEIDSVLENQPKEKEKRLLNRAFKGTTDEELKSLIEDYGRTRPRREVA